MDISERKRPRGLGDQRIAADERALVDEAIRSHRSLRGKDIRSSCKTRWITPEAQV